MSDFLFYCRSGYEADLLAELDDAFLSKGQYGYAKFAKNSGFIVYHVPSSTEQNAKTLSKLLNPDKSPSLRSLIFARQKLFMIDELEFDSVDDRISPILAAIETSDLLPKCHFSDVLVEYPDTDHGKEMAKFCKKFTVPLRAALRKQGLLHKQSQDTVSTLSDSKVAGIPKASRLFLHVFFEKGNSCKISISIEGDRSPHPQGILRLKFPSDAPSRSTLKLEEAIHYFCNARQQGVLFQNGMTAVDLGACPGGWTYQLVKRGMRVEAIDNGAMDSRLMESGLVDYYAADGFSYQPKEGHVDWLVCDMIEKPDRVAALIMQWLKKGKCSAALFNLKLPMKRRYQTLAPIIEQFFALDNDSQQAQPKARTLGEFSAKVGLYISAKHLYHNRDEVTFFILKNSQMCAEMLT
ncbi:23S rRNA (cytidine(2498)-2'-O)-methyltransferase RlmM [Ningiella sp. W23]|uniref:23S rRNA (cytidine(2498)-2'-O)-methyltransferase RlmM n=1 Tax=Ningiella sp. W23 TaxID=3023715 RepID=UPI0037577B56